MALEARDLKTDDTTDAGFDLVTDSIAALSADVGVTKIMFGLAGANDGLVDATTPLPVEIFDVAGTLNADITSTRTAVEKLDNIAHAGSDVALSEHVPISGQFDDTATTTVTEDQIAPVRITSGRALHVAQQGNVTVNSHDVTNAGTFAVQIDAALPAGDNNIGNVDVATIAAGTNLIGDVGIQPRTSGGTSMHKTISAASTNATSVKASAGQVYGIQVYNLNASPRYLKLYDKASAPTVGTDTPVKTLMIPGNTDGSGFIDEPTIGREFTSGIAFALTTGITDADTGAVAADEIAVNLDYE